MGKRIFIRKIAMVCGKLYLTAMAALGIPFFIYCFALHLFAPSALGALLFVLFSIMVAACVELGPLNIKKVAVVGEMIEEQILWGLLRLKTNMADVKGFRATQVISALGGYYHQLTIKRKNRPSILVNEFDQNDFANLQAALRGKVVEDNTLRATEWVELKRLFGLVLALWGITVVVGLGLWVNRHF